MDNRINGLLSLLGEKQECLRQWCLLSEKLMAAEIDRITPCLEQRSEVFRRVKEIDRQIGHLAEEVEEAPAVLSFSAEFSGISNRLRPLHEMAVSVQADVNRLLRMEPQVKEHLESIREGLLAKIEDSGINTSAAVNGYHRCVMLAQSGNRPVIEDKKL